MTAFRRPLSRVSALFASVLTIGTLLAATPSQAIDEREFINSDVELDVDFTPTPMDAVRRMLDMAGVGPDDYVVDLGSGDGRILLTAATEYGVKRALGIEIDPWLVEYANTKAERADVAGRVRFKRGDLFQADFYDASVLTMYLLPELNLRLRPHILSQMKPGTRVVSHAFDMGEWQPDERHRVHLNEVFLWIVPARIDGAWQLEHAGQPPIELTFDQRFQQAWSEAMRAGEVLATGPVEINGAEIAFRVDGQGYRGHVDGDRIRPIEGDAWIARRARR